MRPVLRVLLPCLLPALALGAPVGSSTNDAGVPDADAGLAALQSLQLRVLGPDGAPLAGSHVQLVPESLDSANLWLETNARGEASQPVPAAGRYRAFAFWLEEGHFQRYVWKDLELRPGTDDVRVELRFVRASTPPISGQVMDLEGRPVAGATVTAFQHFTSVPLDGDLLRGTAGPRETVTTTTNAEGRFTLEPLREGEYGLQVTHERGLSDVTGFTGGPSVDMRLVPRCVQSASGRVVDERGAPIKSFRLDSRSVRDAQGRFQLQRACFLNLSAPGYVPRGLPLLSLKSLRTSLPDIVLQKGRQLTGRVTGPAGKPVAEAGLSAFWAGATSTPGPELTPASGRFSLGPVPVGQEVTVVAKWDDRALRQRVAPGKETKVDVRFPAEDSRLEVLVKDASGAPLRGLGVVAEGDWGTVTARTDAEGRVSRSMPSGSYEVRVTHKPSSLSGGRRIPYRFAPVRVELAPGGGAPFEILPTPGSGRLRVLLPEPSHYDSIFVIPGAHPMPADIPGVSALLERPLVADVLPHDREQYSQGIIYYGSQNDFSDLAPGPYTVFATNPRDDGPGLLLFHQVIEVGGRERQVVQVRFEGGDARRLH